MNAYPALFSPGQIGTMTTKNRLVMAPMVRNYADEAGMVTEKYLAHIARIAEGGVGMMILEAMFVSPEARGFSNQLGIHTDDVIPGLSTLVSIAHAEGARIGPQIFHAGRQTSSAVSGLPPLAPSPLPDPTINEIPRELTVGEIQQIVSDFAQAARRAVEAGCDFVEIHGAHGYLVTQFLSEYSNVRTDDYGGSLENRMRFLVEIIEAVRETVGLDFPVTVRLSGEEMVPGGLTLADTVNIARRLEALRVDALHITAGNYASYERGYMIQPMAIPDGPLLPLAEGVAGAVRIPVIAVGKIRTPELAESVIEKGQADFVALGRLLLADPDWPRKAQEGQSGHINTCIACNQGCISRLFENKDVWCTVNPVCARELEFDTPVPAAARRVLIAGGGPAGMEAAKIAAQREHRVTLFEEEEHLGGQLIAATAAPYRPGWGELRQYLIGEMERLNIDVRLNTPLTAEMVRSEATDTVVIATGATPIRLKIPGIEGANVITARDLLEGKVEATGRVIVAGGGCAGAQTAEYLATKGHAVTIVEMLGNIAPDAPRAERELLLDRLHKLGVQIQMETKIMRIELGGVVVLRPSGEEMMPADTVVICLGSTPNVHLAESLADAGAELYRVGDAVKARKVTEAMVEGAYAGLAIGSSGTMREAA